MTEDSTPSQRTSRRDRIRELEEAARALEPGAERLDAWLGAAHGYARRLLAELPERPTYQEDKEPAGRIADFPIGDAPRSVERLLEAFDEAVVRPGILASSGGHLGYIPGGGLYASALADYLAAVTNEYAGVWFASPGAVEMENRVLAWMADLVGYPGGHAGNLASGGSIANLIAIVTAREAAGLRARDVHRAVIYSTSQLHHCVDKALRVAGLGEAIRREVPLDGRYRLDPAHLPALIEADRAAGRRPWMVIASAGTTDVGAIDPMPAIADIAREHGLWFHVDAAYGGFFALVPSCRVRLAGMERSDSLVLDPHKGMFLPYGTGAVLVRDGAALHAAHDYAAPYMQDTVEQERDRRSPASLSPELTKHFRGLRVWLPLMLAGVEPFRACLEEKLELARYFHGEIAAAGFEVGPEPDLSVVIYRWVPGRGDANAFNRALIEAVHADGRVFLSSTLIDGVFWLRLAVLSFRTHLEWIDRTLDLLVDLAEELEARPERWGG
ncbi:MAG: aminotransferase class V-fold PLP-dependent enzyme [Gemmatimonadota bacterium]|nr:aminotransferase class V-fold PLP-dependent enzyme [Gemmatimonadota bacterium]